LKAPIKNEGNNWTVYILRCADDSLYTGITTDIARRVKEHNDGPRGANYTRARRPVVVEFTQPATNRSTASRLEAWIKAQDRKTKESIINQEKDVPEALQGEQI